MLRVGIAGLGFGRHLMDTLLVRDDCTVAAVADHRAERTAPARARGIPAWDDAAKMIAEASLDAVVLATAPHRREAALEAALARGLPVFMEKPLAGSLAGARRVAALCKEGRVMMGFSFRFHGPVQRLLALLPDLGRPRLLNAEYLFDWLPPAENWLWDPARGGGFFAENSCHLFDVVTSLMGMPRTVHANAVSSGARPSATAAAIALGFPDGAAAALTVGGIGTGAFDDFPRLDLACEGGQARMTGAQHMWTGLRWAVRGGDMQEMTHRPEALSRTRYSAALDHFLDGMRDGAPFAATVRDGLAAARIADAVYRSIASGGPVTLEDTA